MEPTTRFQLTNVVLAVLAVGHALATWPVRATAALFLGGAALAFLAEAAVVRAGLLEHAMAPRVAGVPLAVVAAWPAIVYLCLRLALLVRPPGLAAAGLAAVLATAFDLLTDPTGVDAGVWTYPDHPVSAPRVAGVPWWNFAGWLGLVFVSATLPLAAGL